MKNKLDELIAFIGACCVIVVAGNPNAVSGQESTLASGKVATVTTGTVAQQEAIAKKLEQPVEFVNSLKMLMVLIPSGEFQMGSPEGDTDREADETQHRVRITQPFYLATCEVTQSQYAAVMGAEPWKGKKYGPWVFVKRRAKPRSHTCEPG